MKCTSVCGCFFFLVCFLILLALTKDAVDAQNLRPPAKNFRRHKLVQPTVHHGRTKREISSTRDTNGEHEKEITLKIDVDGEEYTLDLRLNDDLVTDNHVISYQKNGKTVLHKPDKKDLNICQYSGHVRDRPGSWVAVSTCHGVQGVIYDGDKMRYIQPAEGNHIMSQHYLYDHLDLTTEHHCGYDGGVTNNTRFDPLLTRQFAEDKKIKASRLSRHKRSLEDTHVRGPFNTNKDSRYVELVLVADYLEYRENNENLDLVHHQLKDIANIINSVYSPLNIFIALVGIVVWNEGDQIPLEEDGDRTLKSFLEYRKTISKQIPNDNAQLLTLQKFKDGVVGKALKGPICTYAFSGSVATNHTEVIGLVAATMAHEMGHNFGMEHDTAEDCTCPDEKCIMSPSSTSVVPVHWSSCSLKSLALAFEKGMDYCLRNKPERLFESPTCGNGFVEAGEECDCGLTNSKEYNACHSCCHPDTCLLRSNATCAMGICCDLDTCRPKSAGTMCRSADRECDLPEFCTGHSEFCPHDVFKMDGIPCGKENEAFCAKGSCRSHTDQCRLLWGTTGMNSNERCYTQNNPKGNQNGNCGYDRINQVFHPCSSEDVKCGLLQCRHLNERLEYGMESVALLSQIFINSQGSIIPCRTAIIDLGINDVDPGMVPDGAKCGENKMCWNHKCQAVDYVKSLIANKENSVCPSNCSGHGVCNSEGHCHCDPGFSPPLCALPGHGGSIDSGPISNPNIQRNFMITMYIIFLGIIPSCLLIMFLFYYSRHNNTWWKKPRKSAQSPKKTSLPHRLSRSATKFASNFQNNSQNLPQPVNVHTVSNPDDMSSSLLRSDSDHSPAGNINPSITFFGNFKGFSLAPIDKNSPPVTETLESNDVTAQNNPNVKIVAGGAKSAKITPVHRSGSNSQNLVIQSVVKPGLRSAPPLPVVPSIAKSASDTCPSIKRTNSSVQNRIKALIKEKTEDVPPIATNPPPKPIISSPILEASTCTAKELISPLQNSKTLGPIRTAPTIPTVSPNLPKRPLSMHSSGVVPQKPLPEEPKKVKEGISLNRIASFLKQDKPKEKERNPVERSHSLPKNAANQIKLPKVALRNLQISNPILQKDIELPVNTVPVVSDSEDSEDPKAFINRAQSMRAPVVHKPAIISFGSMRQAPGAPRPISIVGRPTAPPPPLPNPSTTEATDTPFYQHPKPQADIISTDYVDCIEEKPLSLAHIDEGTGENIYTIIEESPVKHSKPLPSVQPASAAPQAPNIIYNTPKPITTNSGSNESMGLLGEIVNEIQNRNFDSIYSASTLSRKKKHKDKKDQTSESNRDSTYINTDHYKGTESVYSNSGAKSSAASTTSSGYLHPSAVNVPTYLNKQDKDHKIKQENEIPPPSPTAKGPNSKIPTFARQVTPPGLKNTSTFRNTPQSPKNTNRNFNLKLTNSPDVVSSCSITETKNMKPPDVINNNKLPNEAPKVAAKPNVTKLNDNYRPPLRPAPGIAKKQQSVRTTPSVKPAITNKPQIDKNTPLNSTNSKADTNVKIIADNLNKNKSKFSVKPTTTNVQRIESTTKSNAIKLNAKPSNVANLQQKFENRKSFGKDTPITKK